MSKYVFAFSKVFLLVYLLRFLKQSGFVRRTPIYMHIIQMFTFKGRTDRRTKRQTHRQTGETGETGQVYEQMLSHLDTAVCLTI
jgi:hypothetical protein